MYRKASWWLHRILDMVTFKLGMYELSGLYRMRPMIKFIKEHYGNELTGVEIGTYEGYNAYCMMLNLPIKKLYLVDPYLFYEEYYEDSYKMSQHSFDVIFKNARNLLKDYKNKVEFIRLLSHEAKNKIPKALDFVYIDGNHAYEFVMQDIKDYYPKLRKGGVIGGHDFDGNYIGVVRAAIEFTDENNLELYTSEGDWWTVKK